MGLISRFTHPKRVDSKGLILLFTSLSYMRSAGLTLRDGVDILMKNKDHKINRAGLQVLLDGFDEGLVFSEVLKEHEDVFGSGWWRQVDAAERTGKVPECLLRLADQLKHNASIMSKIRGAMAYPIFVVIVALCAGYYLMTNTIPEMGAMLAEFGGELPALTQAMMAACDVMTRHGILVIVIFIVMVAAVIWALKHPLKMQWHTFITKFPLSSGISINLNYSMVYTLINDMIENGSNIVAAVRIAASSATNVLIVKELQGCADTMEREGYGLAAALQDANTMPGDDRMMLDVGSRTGREMELLQDMAARRRVAAEDAVNQLLELLSPIIMLFVCLIVGILVVSVYMPMLTMATQMS